MLTIRSPRYLGAIQDNNRQQQTPTETNRHQETVPGTPKGCSRMCGGSCWHWMAFAGACWCLLVPDGVFLVSYGVWRWEEGVWGFTQSVYECCLWTWLRFGSLWGSIWVFRPCMMQQMLYIGKSPKGKIPHTWHFWNIKIPKPPYVSSLKIIGLLHFLNFWVHQKKITIYSLFGSPCINVTNIFSCDL